MSFYKINFTYIIARYRDDISCLQEIFYRYKSIRYYILTHDFFIFQTSKIFFINFQKKIWGIKLIK